MAPGVADRRLLHVQRQPAACVRPPHPSQPAHPSAAAPGPPAAPTYTHPRCEGRKEIVRTFEIVKLFMTVCQGTLCACRVTALGCFQCVHGHLQLGCLAVQVAGCRLGARLRRRQRLGTTPRLLLRLARPRQLLASPAAKAGADLCCARMQCMPGCPASIGQSVQGLVHIRRLVMAESAPGGTCACRPRRLPPAPWRRPPAGQRAAWLLAPPAAEPAFETTKHLRTPRQPDDDIRSASED